MTRSLILRCCMLALLTLVAPLSASAQTAREPTLTEGFQNLLATAPDIAGIAVESDRPGDHPDSTLALTTTGALYWEPGLSPTWTDGYHRLTLINGEPVRWDGDSLTPPPPPPEATINGTWLALKGCETPGRGWNANTGNSFYGGLQENAAFWSNYGGLKFAARPDLATPEEQIIVAERGLAVQGWEAWPFCSTHLHFR